MGLVGRVGRANQITAVVVRHGLGHYLLGRDRKAPEDPSLPRPAQRFRAILEDLGPTFIKFGQILSTRPDLLPPGFAEALRGLQDRCPAMKSGEAERVIEKSLGAPVDDLFRHFDAEPVASASIAQVHKAVLPGGQTVAVKVRRVGVGKQIAQDLDLLKVLARLVEAILEEGGFVAPSDMVEEFEAAFLRELDFEREARTIERFATYARKPGRTYVVPDVVQDLCSERVLTMSFVDGARIPDLEPGRARAKIANNLVKAAFHQLFFDGLFHADPHPGNTFVLEDDRIAFIDFGSVGEVPPAMRRHLLAFSVALALRDADTVARLIYREGIGTRSVSLYALRVSVDALFGRYLGEESDHASIESAEVVRALLSLVHSFGLRLPREYALMARAVVIAEGSVRQLDPGLQVIEMAEPLAEELVAAELELPDVKQAAMRQFVRGRTLMQELPLAASQVLFDLERGQTQVQIQSRQLQDLVRAVEALGVTVFLGIVAGGLITGSMFLLGAYEAERWIPLVGFGLASAFLGAVFGRYWISPVWRRLRRGGFLRGTKRQ